MGSEGTQAEDFKQTAAGALRFAGVPFTDADLEILQLVAQAFEPAARALDEADLSVLPLDSALDPSRAPRGGEDGGA